MLSRLVYFPITCAPILLEGNGALVAENYVMESVATLQDALHVLQPLDFVGISDKLTITGLLQSSLVGGETLAWWPNSQHSHVCPASSGCGGLSSHRFCTSADL